MQVHALSYKSVDLELTIVFNSVEHYINQQANHESTSARQPSGLTPASMVELQQSAQNAISILVLYLVHILCKRLSAPKSDCGRR